MRLPLLLTLLIAACQPLAVPGPAAFGANTPPDVLLSDSVAADATASETTATDAPQTGVDIADTSDTASPADTPTGPDATPADIPPDCVKDKDCGDSTGCTIDTCSVGGKCVHQQKTFPNPVGFPCVVATCSQGNPVNSNAKDGTKCAADTGTCSQGACALPGMIALPAGRTIRGCANDAYIQYDPEPCDKAASSNESPPKLVDLPAFALDTKEVTNGDWAQCVATGACKAPDAQCLTGTADDVNWSKPERANFPVRCVTWTEADKFCRKFRGPPGLGLLRLPTEAEWERAARGLCPADKQDLEPCRAVIRWYPWGRKPSPPACPTACIATDSNNYGCSTGAIANTAEVATGKYATDATPEGIRDLIGNVAEWTSDADGSINYIVRGGDVHLTQVRATLRRPVGGGIVYPWLGLRCALPASTPQP